MVVCYNGGGKKKTSEQSKIDYLGTWVMFAVTLKYKDGDYIIATERMENPNPEDVMFTLKEGGKAIDPNNPDDRESKWKETEKGISLEDEGEPNLEFTYEDGVLSLEMEEEGEVSVTHLIKQGSEISAKEKEIIEKADVLNLKDGTVQERNKKGN